MVSFIIPAHNEEASLPRTLEAIQETARVLKLDYEIIVVDDASTDRTAEIAREKNATVVPVQHRQIARTRNSGARAAKGDRYFFIDADTTVNPRAVASALRALDKGAVGGGATVWFDGPIPLYISLISLFVGIISKAIGFTGGAFMFCTSEAFHKGGGFDERLFASEEGAFALSLKAQGRFVILWERVVTSGRRVRTTNGLQIFALCVRGALSPVKTLTNRASVQKIWYDSNRSGDDKLPNTFVVKFSNAIALVFILILLSGPIWRFIPWTLTPLETPVGKFRFICRFIIAHTSLRCWPITAALLYTLARQKPNIQSLKLLLLTLLCVLQAYSATRAVIWLWTQIHKWIFG
jgi:glycosyltransferase involved in cell wall biosynthesis